MRVAACPDVATAHTDGLERGWGWVPAKMLTGKPCHVLCPADWSVLPSFCAVVQTRTAVAVLEQWAGLCLDAMLPAHTADAGREGGPVPADSRGAHARPAGRHLAAVLQVSLWGRQGPPSACPVHAISCSRAVRDAERACCTAMVVCIAAENSGILIGPRFLALLASFASLGWPTCNAKVGLRLCYNTGAGICSLWRRPHRSAGT